MLPRKEMLERYSAVKINARIDEILAGMSVEQICKIADDAIKKMPDFMPKKRLRNRGKMTVVKGVLYARIINGEI